MKAIRWLACVLALATLALAAIGLLGLRSAAPVAAGATLVVDDDGQGSASNCDSVVDVAYTTIQAAIDAANPGDTISVCPGTYDKDEANGRNPDTGGAGSNDFNIFVGKALTIQGVNASGAPITNYKDVEANVVAKRELPTFGQSAIFVQAGDVTMGVTITGLEITGWSGTENNKTVEVVGDNVTIKDCAVHGMDSAAALYFDDRHFDSGTNASSLKSYHIEENLIDGGGIWPSGIRFSNGAGWSGDVTNRVIRDNTFQDNLDAIAFVGPQADPWDVYPVGDATITGNSFSRSDRRHVIAWGEYPVGSGNPGYINLDWDGILASNTFDKGAMTWTPGGDARAWDSLPQFKNVRGIYSAIQRYAVNKAVAGDTVEVLPGTYVEAVNIDKALTLKGQPGAIIRPDNTTPLLDGGVRRVAVYVAGVDNVTIDGFEIDGTGGDVHVGVYALNSDNSTVKNNVIHDIKNAIAPPVSDVAGTGILFFGWGQGIDGALIDNNTVYNTGRMGIFVGGVNAPDGWPYLVSSNNVISRNTVHHAWQGPTNDWGGAVQLNAPETSRIERNVIRDTGLNMQGVYIFDSVASTPNSVIQNEIYNNYRGIVIWTNYPDGVPPGTTLGAPEAHLNSIHDTANLGLWNVDSNPAFLVNAEDNWWGSANGPTHASNTFNVGSQGVAVSNNVDFVPWLNAPPPGGVSFAPVTTTSPEGGYASIQAGVNASNPDGTVNAKAGTFTEQPDIAKPLTLTGAGQSSTIIKSPAALATKFANNKPVVYIHDATGVTVQQLTVDGDGKGNANSRMEGVAFYKAGGTVDHVTITRVRETPLSGAQHGVALYANNGDGVPRTLNVSNNTISDYQKNGMALSGAGLTTTVTDNTVTGSGPTGVTAQNGIQVGFGATGTVEDNTVANVSYTGDYYGASGILVTSYSALGYPPSSADVTSNTVTNAQVGIYYGEGSGQADGNTVSASAAGVGRSDFWGIVVVDPPGLSPSPFEEAAAPPAGGFSAAPMGAGVMTVVVSDNKLTGDGSAGSVGLEADAGWGPENVSFTGRGNTISNWGTGVVVAQCTEDCSGAVFTSVDVGPDNNITAPTADQSDSGLHAMGSVNLNVHNNTFTGGYDAIKLRLAVTGTVENNVVSEYAKNGITAGKAADDNTGTNVTVSGNTVTGGGPGQVNAQNGIQVGPNAVARIENNTVSNHVYTLGTGACAGPGTKGDAAYYDACWTAAGVMVYQGRATVTSNIITGNQIGVDDSGAETHYNIIRDNIVFGVNNVSAGVANAENNWWGACDGPGPVGPGSGDAVSTLVDYDPWLHGACDSDSDLLTDDAEQLVWFTDWQNPDTDGDGCADGEEALYSDPTLGGQRDPLNPWDFFDVPLPVGAPGTGTRDKQIDGNDALAVLAKFGASPGDPIPTAPKYDPAYDRSAPSPHSWNTQAPNGVQDGNDVMWNLWQFGHSCFPPP